MIILNNIYNIYIYYMSNPNYTDGDPNYTIPNPRLNPSNANILKKKGITVINKSRIHRN